MQISLRIHAVSSEFSLGYIWEANDAMFLGVFFFIRTSESLIRLRGWVFARRTYQKVRFLTLWLILFLDFADFTIGSYRCWNAVNWKNDQMCFNVLYMYYAIKQNI